MSQRSARVWAALCAVAMGCGGDDSARDETRDESEPTAVDAAVEAGSAPPPLAVDGGQRDGSMSSTPGLAPDARAASAADAGLREPNTRSDAATASADAAAPTAMTPLDCGPNGVAIENAGPPANRVNYVILGDGYSREQLDTTFLEHIKVAMAKRFGPIGQPYGRYRKFVNICAIKTASASSPIGAGATPFSCTGDDESRLARCNQQAANTAIMTNLPASFEVDWKAIVLNNDRWWNTGAVLMLWSGANKSAAGAALHEGGHGFHQLADEYAGTNGNCEREYGEVNSTADMAMTAGKWDRWLNYDQAGATGRQGTFAGSRYCESAQFRPSGNSMMNSLFGENPNTSFNSVSREKMVMDIWRVVRPIDVSSPPPGQVQNPASLSVQVVDPAVIDVEWTLDGAVLPERGAQFDVASRKLSAGMHTVSARAYDNAGEDLVRYRTGGTTYGRMNWARSQQTVSWTVVIP